MYNRKIDITENEKSRILGLYRQEEPSFFDNYLTIDGRFFIKNDVLFDLHEQKELGDLFSIKNLKILFENVNVKKSEFIESVKQSLNEVVNEKMALHEIKREILINKVLLTERENVNSEPQADNKGGSNSIIGKGVLWIARKIKSLLWSIGGMAVDAFLVASGIGKTVQWIPWAIVLALDTYQWTSGDYGSDTEFKNSSTFWKILTIGFEIMGMMTSGPLAKAAQKIFKPVKAFTSEAQIARFVETTPKAKGFLTRLSKMLSGVSGWINKAAGSMSSKMPTLGKWLSKSASAVGKGVSWVANFLGKILGAPGKLAGRAGEAIQGTKLGTKVLGRGQKLLSNVEKETLQKLISTSRKLNKVEKEFVNRMANSSRALSKEELTALERIKSKRLNKTEMDLINKLETSSINLGAGLKSGTNTASVVGGMEYAGRGNKNSFSLGKVKPEYSYEDI